MLKAPATNAAENTGAQPSYLPGLDGLRAFAVILVLLYHADVTWFRGGFLGVEIFFVISGYLITTLLLKEWRKTGTIHLGGFWLRRARRLLPALFLLLLGTLGFAVIFLRDEVAGLRGDTLAALGYVSNWYLIFSRQSYFEAVGRPSLLRHLWSLAVEEQFYLCWPLLLTLGLRPGRGRFVLPAVGLGIVASTALMVLLYNPNVDPSRVYYGTDTRAAGLLIGVALAFLWNPAQLRGTARPALLDAVAFGALADLTLYCIFFHEYSPFLYLGGFTLISLTTAAAIAAAVHPDARWGPAVLDFAPLRWIGQRSYGIYLWHWPIFMITRPQLDVALDGLPLAVLRFALTVLVAELSYRFVETPIRNGALGRAWQSLREARGRRRWWLGARWGSLAGAVTVSTLALGISVAGAQPPPPPEYLAVASFQGIVSASTDTPTPPVTVSPTVLPVASPTNGPTLAAGSVTAPNLHPTATFAATFTPTGVAPRPTLNPEQDFGRPDLPTRSLTRAPLATLAPTRSPDSTPGVETSQPVTLTYIMAIGDSVMLGATKEMAQTLGSLTIDAAIGRHVGSVIEIVRARREAGLLSEVIIVQVGNNGLFNAKMLSDMLSELADRRRVIIINLKVPRAWQDPNNAVLAEGVKRFPNAVLVDWYAASVDHPEYFWDDGMHLRPEGARLYAQLIAAQLGALNPPDQAEKDAGGNPLNERKIK